MVDIKLVSRSGHSVAGGQIGAQGGQIFGAKGLVVVRYLHELLQQKDVHAQLSVYPLKKEPAIVLSSVDDIGIGLRHIQAGEGLADVEIPVGKAVKAVRDAALEFMPLGKC